MNAILFIVPSPYAGSKFGTLSCSPPRNDDSCATSPGAGGAKKTDADAGHSHDHKYGLGRMRQDYQRRFNGMRRGKLTPELVRQAMQSLRYMK